MARLGLAAALTLVAGAAASKDAGAPGATDVHFRMLEAFDERGIHPPSVLHRSATSVS